MKEEDRRAANAALLGKVDEVIGHALTDKELVPAARVPILKGTHVDRFVGLTGQRAIKRRGKGRDAGRRGEALLMVVSSATILYVC